MTRSLALSVVLASAVCLLAAVPAAAQPVFAVAGANLVSFDTDTPGTIDSTDTITGLQMGETIVGIDFSFHEGVETLYGIGSTSRLYAINKSTGVAAQVGSGPFTPALSGSSGSTCCFSVDMLDHPDLRVISDSEQSLIVDVTDGTATAGPAPFYISDDPNNGADPSVVGGAYAGNEFFLGIDSNTDDLVSLFEGQFLETVAPLGVDTAAGVGFDRSMGGRAFAVMTVGGVPRLYYIKANTNPAAILVGTVGATITGGISMPEAQPQFLASSSPLSFGPQALGSVGPSRTLTLRLTGGDAIEIGPRDVAGPHRDDFFVMSDNCGPGHRLEPPPFFDSEPGFEACTVRFRFAPGGLGTRNALYRILVPACCPQGVIFQTPLTGTGTAAPTGPAGPPGPAGRDRALLAAALGLDRYRVRRRRRLRVRYVSTLAGSVALDVLRGNRRVSRTRGRTRRGRNRIRIRAPRRAGRYRLRLRVRAGTQTSTDRAGLRVTR